MNEQQTSDDIPSPEHAENWLKTASPEQVKAFVARERTRSQAQMYVDSAKTKATADTSKKIGVVGQVTKDIANTFDYKDDEKLSLSDAISSAFRNIHETKIPVNTGDETKKQLAMIEKRWKLIASGLDKGISVAGFSQRVLLPLLNAFAKSEDKKHVYSNLQQVSTKDLEKMIFGLVTQSRLPDRIAMREYEKVIGKKFSEMSQVERAVAETEIAVNQIMKEKQQEILGETQEKVITGKVVYTGEAKAPNSSDIGPARQILEEIAIKPPEGTTVNVDSS